MRQFSIVDQQVWDSGYEKLAFAVSEDQVLNDFLKQYIPRKSGALLEIGCFPGRYLPILADFGYVPSGVDLTPRLAELPAWLHSLGIVPGEFFQEDFGSFSPSRHYDAVVSFGFIEHFSNWPAVFEKHCDLVAPGGVVCVTFPNFRGTVQRILHGWLDAANLRRHVLSSMQAAAYKRFCEKKNWEILFSGYFGGFDFWVDDGSSHSYIQKKIFSLALKATRLKKYLPSLPLYAPHGAIIARRPKEE